MDHDSESIDCIIQRLRDPLSPDVNHIRRMPRDRLGFWPYLVTNEVIITRERCNHYLLRHPEIERLESLLIRSLLEPSDIHVNRLDQQMAIIAQQLDGRRLLRIPLWISDRPDRQNSVLSSRIAGLEEVLNGRMSERVAWTKR
jgi:hypothetical protein